jgi:GNAT superfamily N-acetyltransferase
MSVQITEIGTGNWAAYFSVSPAFLVTSTLECETVNGGFGGIKLTKKAVTTPYSKFAKCETHKAWEEHFDLNNWGIFLATDSGRPVGGAAVAPPTPTMIVSQGQPDTTTLFDLRVTASARRSGVGTALFRRAVEWARSQGCKFLVIETQDNNVPACRFYARQGCELLEIRRLAYRLTPLVAHENMLIWRLAL